jgi:hypothetical protein
VRPRVVGWWCRNYAIYRWSVYRGAVWFGTYFSWREALGVALWLAVRR